MSTAEFRSGRKSLPARLEGALWVGMIRFEQMLIPLLLAWLVP
jgi:hypothetical protein